MSLDNLPKTTEKSKKRIGRGHGSGKGGHTVGKGKYGQKSRKGKIPLMFEGTKNKKSLLKRLPLLRGKGKFKSFRAGPVIINLKYLNLFKEGEVVNLETLVSKKLISKEDKVFGVKILGEGELNFPLTVEVRTSKGARIKIEKVGGKVETTSVISKKQVSDENRKVKTESPVKKAQKNKKDEKNK